MTSRAVTVSGCALVAIALTASAALGAPAPDAAERPDEPGTQQPFNHWRYDHWPQVQPWQEQQSDAELSRVRARGGVGKPGFPAPVDPQEWENPDHMTWSDYTPIPGTDWADPDQSRLRADLPRRPGASSTTPTSRSRSPSRPTPRSSATRAPRRARSPARTYPPSTATSSTRPTSSTAATRSTSTGWRTPAGRYGVELTEFGAYQMPGKSHEYAMEFQGEGSCPTGDSCDQDLRTDAFAAWQAAEGADVRDDFDFVYILSAGQDESSTWQEFGPMKWEEQGAGHRRRSARPTSRCPTGRRPATSTGPRGRRARRCGPTPAAAPPPRRRAPAWACTPTSSATCWGSGTTTTTRSATRRAGPTAASGRCSAVARSTGRAVRTAGGPSRPPAAARWAPSTCCATR